MNLWRFRKKLRRFSAISAFCYFPLSNALAGPFHRQKRVEDSKLRRSNLYRITNWSSVAPSLPAAGLTSRKPSTSFSLPGLLSTTCPNCNLVHDLYLPNLSDRVNCADSLCNLMQLSGPKVGDVYVHTRMYVVQACTTRCGPGSSYTTKSSPQSQHQSRADRPIPNPPPGNKTLRENQKR